MHTHSQSSTALRFDKLSWERIEDQLRTAQDDEEEDQENSEGRRLYCAKCRRLITREDQRIRIQGMHEHVFSNPQGLVFRIGCFATAPGCGHVGAPTEEWTWFPGHQWQIAVCGSCGAHIGWRYISGDGNLFHGLILWSLVSEASNP